MACQQASAARPRGKGYLLPCTITTRHQLHACALAVPREVDSRVDFHLMLIVYVHAHLVLERNRRHIPMRLTTFCCGYVHISCCVPSEAAIEHAWALSPRLALPRGRSNASPSRPTLTGTCIGGFSPCTQVWRGLTAVTAAHALLAVRAVPTPPS